MKRKLTSLLMLTSLAAASSTSQAQSADINEQLHAGILKSVRGEVLIQEANGAAQHKVFAGDPIMNGQRLLTGTESSASMVLRDGTSLVVGPSSRFEMNAFKFDSTTQSGSMLVSLLKGTMRFVSGLMAKTTPESVRINTRTATVGVRGTDFIVEEQN